MNVIEKLVRKRFRQYGFEHTGTGENSDSSIDHLDFCRNGKWVCTVYIGKTQITIESGPLESLRPFINSFEYANPEFPENIFRHIDELKR